MGTSRHLALSIAFTLMCLWLLHPAHAAPVEKCAYPVLNSCDSKSDTNVWCSLALELRNRICAVDNLPGIIVTRNLSYPEINTILPLDTPNITAFCNDVTLIQKLIDVSQQLEKKVELHKNKECEAECSESAACAATLTNLRFYLTVTQFRNTSWMDYPLGSTSVQNSKEVKDSVKASSSTVNKVNSTAVPELAQAEIKLANDDDLVQNSTVASTSEAGGSIQKKTSESGKVSEKPASGTSSGATKKSDSNLSSTAVAPPQPQPPLSQSSTTSTSTVAALVPPLDKGDNEDSFPAPPEEEKDSPKIKEKAPPKVDPDMDLGVENQEDRIDEGEMNLAEDVGVEEDDGGADTKKIKSGGGASIPDVRRQNEVVDLSHSANRISKLPDSEEPYMISDVEQDSGYFQYFLTITALLFLGFFLFMNKKRLIALLVEGRRPSSHGRRGRRSSSSGGSAYRKLENNFE